jgi:DNA-binding MarR family transcriptional regulator
MSNHEPLPFETTIKVRDTCLCLHLQRAARAVARHFDELMRPAGLTSGQFSILMSLNRPEPPTIRSVAELLAMDRTTLTANLKPLERRRLVRVRVDAADRRNRRLVLTAAGRRHLIAALPAWENGHAMIEPVLAGADINRLRADLRSLA